MLMGEQLKRLQAIREDRQSFTMIATTYAGSAANVAKSRPTLVALHQACRLRSINPHTNNMSTAPTMAPIKPAF